jgi:hypothetical protein
LNFFDFAWSTAFQLSKKTYAEIRILLNDDLKYPYLGRDKNGYVLHLVKPQKVDDNHVIFQGQRFNLQDANQKKMIWFLFKASVYHLCLHSKISDFSVYSRWGKDKHLNMSTFVASLVEDAAIDSEVRQSCRWMLPETVYSNAVSFLRMKDVRQLPNNVSRVMAAILERVNCGKIKGNLEPDMGTDVEAVSSILRRIPENPTLDEKIDAAAKVYDAVKAYGETFEVPSLLYTESHGRNDLFYEKRFPNEEELRPVLIECACNVDPESKDEARIDSIIQGLKENEAHQALTLWREREKNEMKILGRYSEIDKDTQFEDVEFPAEDYSEYQRRRAQLSSPIRRVLHQLRLLKNVGGEDFRQESGFVDLQEAIQVIASKSKRTDVFAREELQTREDSWSILIDASHSLGMFHGEVRGIALSLAEVAKMLILNQNSWGMYAFNNKFYVIKDPSERYDVHVKARIGGLSHGGFTFLPDAIQLAAQALTKRIEEAKILVVVSDFFPAGYEGADERMKEVIKKVEHMGVGIIGIGVNSRAVKKYIRVNCVVEGPYDLMKKFTKAFMEFG